MKNQLLFNFMQPLFRKMSFRMAAFTVLTLLTAQSSFAQVNYSWTGATNLELSNVGNWAAASVPPTSITSADNYTVTTASGTITNSAAFTCRTLTINQGITVDANANITANTNNTSSVNGTLNIKAGICNFQKCYVGAGTGSTGVVNVEVGATLTGNNNVWRVGANASPATGTININGGTMTLTGTGSLSLGYLNTGVMNLNSGTATIATTAGFSLTAKGTINVAGGVWNHGPVNISNDGTINVTNGVFKLSNAAATINNSTTAATTAATGVININGTTAKLEASGTLAIGNSFAGSTGLVTVNVNSGTMDVGGALTISAPSGIYTGLINIDAGSIVLTGNQTAGIAALITASRIKTSGAALAAGKIISNTYDAGTNKTTVTAIAASSNTAPVVNNDAIIVAPGGTATALVGGTATSVLTNDTDAEGNTLTAAVVTGPANGALTLNSNGTFSYVHNGSATTSDSFTYKANDGTVDSSNTATVTITISSVNNAPVANNDAFSVKQGGTVVTAGAPSV
jgi:VCBS repeat-containing protein